jgi:hypothetical protein
MTAASEPAHEGVSGRSTAFGAVDSAPPPPSVQIFGLVFLGLWLGMLALVYYARRRQLALRALVSDVEQLLRSRQSN